VPENIAVYVAIAALLAYSILCAALITHVLIKLRQQNANANDGLRLAVQDIASRLQALEQRLESHREDLGDIRLAVSCQTRDPATTASLEAIRAAKDGVGTRDIMKRFNLREAEARLLVSVYGLDSASRNSA